MIDQENIATIVVGDSQRLDIVIEVIWLLHHSDKSNEEANETRLELDPTELNDLIKDPNEKRKYFNSAYKIHENISPILLQTIGICIQSKCKYS